jgi:hypothetical protein
MNVVDSSGWLEYFSGSERGTLDNLRSCFIIITIIFIEIRCYLEHL